MNESPPDFSSRLTWALETQAQHLLQQQEQLQQQQLQQHMEQSNSNPQHQTLKPHTSAFTAATTTAATICACTSVSSTSAVPTLEAADNTSIVRGDDLLSFLMLPNQDNNNNNDDDDGDDDDAFAATNHWAQDCSLHLTTPPTFELQHRHRIQSFADEYAPASATAIAQTAAVAPQGGHNQATQTYSAPESTNSSPASTSTSASSFAQTAASGFFFSSFPPSAVANHTTDAPSTNLLDFSLTEPVLTKTQDTHSAKPRQAEQGSGKKPGPRQRQPTKTKRTSPRKVGSKRKCTGAHACVSECKRGRVRRVCVVLSVNMHACE